tara:strand:- start:133 stop:846 length:714 start_codon:yes stop_codon:yes gene_type:complete
MLKAQLHIHTKEDPQDESFIKYTAKELIDLAADQEFTVLAITCHNEIVFNQELKQRAMDRNILLIPAVERTIGGKHVLIYNITEEESQQITSFDKLRQWREDKIKEKYPFLVIAAHPFFYGPSCLKKIIIRHLDLFDAWEYSFFYTKLFNPNHKMIKLSKEYFKPIIGNADVHKVKDLSRTYSMINSEKDIRSIFEAIRNQQVELKTHPLSTSHFFKTTSWVLFSFPFKLLKKYKNL